MSKLLVCVAVVLGLALVSVAAWKIASKPPCAAGYVLHTSFAYDYGLNPNGKFGFGYHPHTLCVPSPPQ